MRERAARRRPRRCSPLLLLVLLVMAATICYTYLILLRLRRQPQGNQTAEADAAAAAARAADAKATAAIADAKARSAAEAAEAALTKDVEAFEQQHAEWVEGAANKHAAADDGVARAKRRRQAKAEQRALAAAETSGAAARPEEDQADGCSSDPAVGCMASPAVIIMSHDRADMLSRSLGLVCPMRMARHFAVYVSEDAGRAEIAAAAKAAACVRDVLRYRQPPKQRFQPAFAGSGYAKISRHFKAALQAVLGVPPTGRGHSHAVVLEDDLLLSPDTLLFFWSSAWLLQRDVTLWCVSAWNDQGYPHVATRSDAIGRTDYFPGLGWMVTGDTWNDELAPHWPEAATTGWDHWMRLSSTSRGRECLRPEVPRTRHASKRGTNVKDNRPFEAFGFAEHGVGSFGDLHHLLRPAYDDAVKALFAPPAHITAWREGSEFWSTPVPGQGKLQAGGGSFWSKSSGDAPAARQWLEALGAGTTTVVAYTRENYRSLATPLGLWKESPRGTHNGTILLRSAAGATLVLADRRKCPWLPPQHAFRAAHAWREVKAAPGASCAAACQGAGMRCQARELEWVMSCEALARHFPCEAGCGHQVGDELPAYVHDSALDTYQQCLVSDIAFSTCEAAFSKTTRLCRCVPEKGKSGLARLTANSSKPLVTTTTRQK